MNNYPEYKNLNLPQIGNEILKYWEQHDIFKKSISLRKNCPPFVFYEGPPSANGMPGIHHVMSRAIKDIFCRYQTLNGKEVNRKAGWDTHGLPIELSVEKTLGITKEDIGKSISVEDYNAQCKKEVLKYQDKWENLTRQMGYWVDMSQPYITYENKYIESVWWLLKKLYSKNLLYKGFTIQPYSPAAGTGLSTHELNQPGCYRNVKDTSAVAMFKLKQDDRKENLLFSEFPKLDVYFLAWTTTPWTLPSNTALAVGKNIIYQSVRTFNPYSGQEIIVILASDLLNKYFPEENKSLDFEAYKKGDKKTPFQLLDSMKGGVLAGNKYEQLLPFSQPTDGNAFEVVCGDFVTTADGTGIVHIAPSFGADDFRVARQNGIGSLTLVDKRGRFLPEVSDGVFLYGEEFVKEDYLSDEQKKAEFAKQKKVLEQAGKIKDLKEYLNVDKRIVLKLQEEGKLFKKEIYEHSYPHCWRTDKPVLYYPLDSWFVKVTEYKKRMSELNETIHWKPEHTGTGRFGEWLNNLQDWNLSRSRFWGIPLPVWRTEDGSETKCIGSEEELRNEIEKAAKAGLMESDFLKKNPDLHKPYIDRIVLVSDSGKAMRRESDLIDVWFDSGSMPYAQWNYPFSNKELIDSGKAFPADFIAEGVDQTRGWFYTLHAIATLCFDSVAFKNVVSNGLVLDKNGNKMSKRLGNAVDPFETLHKFGPDAVRWYMISNADPWDNLKYDESGIAETQRSFFGTFYNTYSFFALYANIDEFNYDRNNLVPHQSKSELDRWILSKLNSLVKEVKSKLDDFDPTPACRAIENFLDEHLSNWYVRLSRRRFWKGKLSEDKKAAFETLYECLYVLSQLSSPFAPFFSEWMYRNITQSNIADNPESIHHTLLLPHDSNKIDKGLEEKMDIAQKVSSMIFSIRKKENIRVRQPLLKMRIPVLNEAFKEKLTSVKELILSEVNVKEMELVGEQDAKIIKNLRLNFKTLGKKYGAQMKAIQSYAGENQDYIIHSIESANECNFQLGDVAIRILPEDVEIIPVDIPGWKVANNGPITVALDITITQALKEEGMARELINRIQNIRKDKKFEVTDKIQIKVSKPGLLHSTISNYLNYICNETLAVTLEVTEDSFEEPFDQVEIEEGVSTQLLISKSN